MKKKELVINIAEITGDTKKASKEFLEAFINTVIQGLIDDRIVEVEGLGTFTLKVREANNARNPLTGELIQVPKLNAIYFKACQDFKENVNK